MLSPLHPIAIHIRAPASSRPALSVVLVLSSLGRTGIMRSSASSAVHVGLTSFYSCGISASMSSHNLVFLVEKMMLLLFYTMARDLV